MSLFASYFFPCLARFTLRRFFAPQGFGHQVVGEHELGLAHVLDREQDLGYFAFGRVIAPDPYSFAFGSDQHATETLAALDRHSGFELYEMPRIALEIRFAHQRSVDTGRGNLEAIGPFDGIGDIEYGR